MAYDVIPFYYKISENVRAELDEGEIGEGLLNIASEWFELNEGGIGREGIRAGTRRKWLVLKDVTDFSSRVEAVMLMVYARGIAERMCRISGHIHLLYM